MVLRATPERSEVSMTLQLRAARAMRSSAAWDESLQADVLTSRPVLGFAADFGWADFVDRGEGSIGRGFPGFFFGALDERRSAGGILRSRSSSRRCSLSLWRNSSRTS